MVARCTDEEFIALWEKYPSATDLAKVLKVDPRNIQQRRKRIQERHGVLLASPHKRSPTFQVTIPNNGVRVGVQIDDGVIIVGSDAHYIPSVISAAHRAFLKLIKELQPKMIVLNGDVFDGGSVSRHPRIGWSKAYTVKQELDAARERLSEIEAVSANSRLHWTWGNHDLRFSSRLASQTPEYEGVFGFHLPDHFPRWNYSTSVMVNGHTLIKHRWHNGIHATYNNTLKAGVSMVTGHLHSLKVTPWTDYSEQKTRYGVDTGTLADPHGEQFDYSEDSPKNHRSGFAVLTFFNGKLMPPELCEVVDEEGGVCYFRGEIITV